MFFSCPQTKMSSVVWKDVFRIGKRRTLVLILTWPLTEHVIPRESLTLSEPLFLHLLPPAVPYPPLATALGIRNQFAKIKGYYLFIDEKGKIFTMTDS